MSNEPEFEDHEDQMESGEANNVWSLLTPEQQKYFKKLSEKSEDNLRYIG